MQANGDSTKAKQRAHVETAMKWADTNLRWLGQEIEEMGPSSVREALIEIGNDLRSVRGPIWEIIRNNLQTPPFAIPENSPLFGMFEIPEWIDGEERTWIEFQLGEVERIIKSAVDIASSQTKLSDFPSRDGFIGEWTRIRRFDQRSVAR